MTHGASAAGRVPPPPVLLFFTAFIAFSVRCVFDWPFDCSLAQLELSGRSTPDPPPPPVVIWVLQTWGPRVSALLGLFWNHHFCGCNPMENVVSRLQEGSLWVSKCWCSWNSMCSCVLGCMLACWAPFCNDEHFSFHCRTARHIPEQRPCAIADLWPTCSVVVQFGQWMVQPIKIVTTLNCESSRNDSRGS